MMNELKDMVMFGVPAVQFAFYAAVAGGIIGCVTFIVAIFTLIRNTSPSTFSGWLTAFWVAYCSTYGIVAMVFVIQHGGQ